MFLLARAVAVVNGAIRRDQVDVLIPRSNLILTSFRLLRDYGFINGIVVYQYNILVLLKFFERRPVLKQINIISTSGRKVFASIFSLNYFLSKIRKNAKSSNQDTFLVVLTTSSGVVSHDQALRLNKGGCPLFIAYA